MVVVNIEGRPRDIGDFVQVKNFNAGMCLDINEQHFFEMFHFDTSLKSLDLQSRSKECLKGKSYNFVCR